MKYVQHHWRWLSALKKGEIKYRLYPLDTVELTKRASRWLRLTSQRTMHIAETLYQRGFLSYPRTELIDFQRVRFARLIGQHTNANGWGQYAQRLLNNNEFRTPTRGNKDEAFPYIQLNLSKRRLMGLLLRRRMYMNLSVCLCFVVVILIAVQTEEHKNIMYKIQKYQTSSAFFGVLFRTRKRV